VWYTKPMMNLNVFSQKCICVAISGGVDSVALLHYLKTHAATFGYTLCAAHCEHGIRGEESVADMRFVEAFCKKLGVPLFIFREDCFALAKNTKESLETAARNFRKRSFATLLEKGEADYIATAHHALDQAETVLFRIARGTALWGARGISEKDGAYVRPFLSWSRKEIEAYARENGLEYRVDKTNFQQDATRNKLRLEILPRLETAVSGATGNIAGFAQVAAEDDALLQEYAKELLSFGTDENGEWVEVAFCDKKPLFRRATLAAMQRLVCARDYTKEHLEGVFALQNSERGARLDLPQGLQAQKTEKGVLFRVKTEKISCQKSAVKNFDKNGFDGGMYEVNVSLTPVEDEKNGWKTLRFDGAKIPDTAVFRFRKDGDKMRCFGSGTKTLKKLFNEKKIDVDVREYLPLIAEKEGDTVYAVCGVEIAEDIKITEQTQEIVYLSIKKKQ